MLCLLAGTLLTGPKAEALSAPTDFNKALNRAGGKGTPATAKGVRTVVIDAGHGGKDPGGSGPKSQEKDIVLDVATLLSIGIRTNYPDVRVIMTRDDDTFLPLHERAAIANQADADLFISIHANVIVGSPATRGTETFVMGQHVAASNLAVAKRENASILLEDNVAGNYGYDPNSPEGHIMLSNFQHAHLERSIDFADRVEQAFAAGGRKSRGVKQAGFAVLRLTTMPSVLVELGFMTNASEEAYLLSDGGQREMADALLSAFGDYHRDLGGSVAQSPPATDRSRYWTAKGVSPTAIRYVAEPEASPATPPTAPTQRAGTAPREVIPADRLVSQHTVRPRTYSNATTGRYVAVAPRPVPVNPSVTSPTAPPRPFENFKVDTSGYDFGQAQTAETRRPKKADASELADKNLSYAIQFFATERNLAVTDEVFASIPYPITKLKAGKLNKYQCRFKTAAEARAARVVIDANWETMPIAFHRGVQMNYAASHYLLKTR